MRRVVSVVMLIVAATAVLVLVAAGIRHSSTPPRGALSSPPADPSGRGPYQVGAARRSISRLSTATGTPQQLDLVVWYPATLGTPPPDADKSVAAPLDAEPDRSGAPYPLALFSHGSGGISLTPTSFTTHLASHGFVVIAPAHASSRTERPAELISVLDHVSDQISADDGLQTGLVDGRRVGVTGWSLGGDSALRTIAKDQRFRAVVAMAPGGPGTGPPSLTDAVSDIVGPTMLMWGRLDDLVPYVHHRALLNHLGEHAPSRWRVLGPATPPRWLVTLPRAGHSAFGDQCPSGRQGCAATDLPQDQAHVLINRWATAFLLHHVAGDVRYQSLLDPTLGVDDPEIRVAFAPTGKAMPASTE